MQRRGGVAEDVALNLGHTGPCLDLNGVAGRSWVADNPGDFTYIRLRDPGHAVAPDAFAEENKASNRIQKQLGVAPVP